MRLLPAAALVMLMLLVPMPSYAWEPKEPESLMCIKKGGSYYVMDRQGYFFADMSNVVFSFNMMRVKGSVSMVLSIEIGNNDRGFSIHTMRQLVNYGLLDEDEVDDGIFTAQLGLRCMILADKFSDKFMPSLLE